MSEVCVVGPCERGRVGRQVYCKSHYTYWRKTGRPPTHALRPVGLSLMQRWFAKVEKTDTCWLWTATLCPQGYGRFTYDDPKYSMAHRWGYEVLVGPVPDGLVLDHLCRVRHCVNPAHLEPVTNRENILRGVSSPAQNAAKTHCKNGHEFTPENTWINHARGGHRRCRACQAAQVRETRAKQRAAVS